MNWLIPKAVSKKGMARPAEYTVSKRMPRAIVSLAAASARTAVRIGPMQGVQPKANAKPSRKPLQSPGCVMLLRRCTSRFSQRAKAGPKNPINESEKKCMALSPANSGPCRSSAATPRAARITPRITPMRNLSLMSAPMRCKPKRRINAPATGASRLRFCLRKAPTALAEAPKAMNTTEKPATKATAEENSPERGTSPWRSCSIPMPESMEM